MAWVACDLDGTEKISVHPPFKHKNRPGKWCHHVYEMRVMLPKGSIKKLIGRDLTFEDEPVELK